jgi:hypothetical protein
VTPWQYATIGLTLALALALLGLRGAVRAEATCSANAATFQETVRRDGEAAKAEAAATVARNDKTIKEMQSAWDAEKAVLGAQAVRNFVARYGDPRRGAGVRDVSANTGAGGGQAVPENTGVPSAGEPERVSAGGGEGGASCPEDFIAACAEDARARRMTREWADRVGISVEYGGQ